MTAMVSIPFEKGVPREGMRYMLHKGNIQKTAFFAKGSFDICIKNVYKYTIFCVAKRDENTIIEQTHSFLMNIFSRILLSLLAIAGVGALGYYAYTLTSQTLTLPFAFSEEQYGDTLELVVAPPSFQITKRSDVLFDSAAIRSSLVRDDVSVAPEILASEYSVDITNAYIRIEYTKKDKKISAPLTLSATLYNKHRTTPYRLPKDITLIPTDVPKDVSIDREGDPRDQIYNITLYGPGEYNPDQMRYYVHYDASLDCRIASW